MATQRRLEIARAMCTDPVLLCLDEPAAGLNPRESAELDTCCCRIRDEHATSILLIEHDMSVVMEISDHVVVLDYGVKIADGTPEARAQRPEGDRRLSRRRGGRGRRGRGGGRAVSALPSSPCAASPPITATSPRCSGVDHRGAQGEIVTLIGANGAGKSTLMMTICGNPRAREGRSSSTAGTSRDLPTHEIVRLRIAQAPEGRRIFPRMTVMENLQMGAAVDGSAHFDERSRARVRAVPAPEGAPLSAAARCPAANSRCSRSRAR